MSSFNSALNVTLHRHTSLTDDVVNLMAASLNYLSTLFLRSHVLVGLVGRSECCKIHEPVINITFLSISVQNAASLHSLSEVTHNFKNELILN